MQSFFNKVNDAQIVNAIQRAESKTSGEIRVYIADISIWDPVAAARREFSKRGMSKTADRNGVLIFIAPQSKNFSIVGDEGVHSRCGDGFWQEVAVEMQAHFRSDNPTEAIVHGVSKAGEILAMHFPRKTDDKNELPDDVLRG